MALGTATHLDGWCIDPDATGSEQRRQRVEWELTTTISYESSQPISHKMTTLDYVLHKTCN